MGVGVCLTEDPPPFPCHAPGLTYTRHVPVTDDDIHVGAHFCPLGETPLISAFLYSLKAPIAVALTTTGPARKDLLQDKVFNRVRSLASSSVQPATGAATLRQLTEHQVPWPLLCANDIENRRNPTVCKSGWREAASQALGGQVPQLLNY